MADFYAGQRLPYLEMSKIWKRLPWRTLEKFSGVQVYGRFRRGSGGGASRTPEKFRKFAKKFLKKIAKMHYFSIIFKKI